MRRELAEWADIMRHGNPTPPRSKPKSEDSLRSQLYFGLPALNSWATTHDSLREISRTDVLAALPPSGAPRACMAQALRSMFRALKARRFVFGNPMFRIHVPAPAQRIPTVPDFVRLREAPDSPNPARALVAALLAYQAVRIHQLRDLKLTNHCGSRRTPAQDRPGPYRRTAPGTVTGKPGAMPAGSDLEAGGAYLRVTRANDAGSRRALGAWHGAGRQRQTSTGRMAW